jgi:hypothetical protein
MSSRISYNVHAQALGGGRERFLQHIQKVQPRAILILDDIDLCKVVKGLLPNTIVIHRQWPDDDIHLRMSPADWIKMKQRDIGGADLWAYTSNEPGFNQQLIDWHVQVMKLAPAAGLKLVVGNFAVGTPGADSWSAARPLLELLDRNRSTMILGLHEYACGVITSGFIGGYPQFIQPNTWPGDVTSTTLWHLGRYKFLVSYCRSIGINPPRIILTEHGFDDVSDIKPWAERLLQTGPYHNIRGWKSIVNQWNDWYNPLGWSAERAYFEQLSYADRVIYQNSPVEAQCIFSWGHSSGDWDQFDVADALEFQRMLEAYAAQQGPAASVAPTPAASAQAATAAPVPSSLVAHPTLDGVRIREVAATGKPIGQANIADALDVLDAADVARAKIGVAGEWVHVRKQKDGITGYMAAQFLTLGDTTAATTATAAPTPAASVTATAAPTPVVNTAPRLADVMSADDVPVVAKGFRAAAARKLFADTVNANLTRWADTVEKLGAK